MARASTVPACALIAVIAAIICVPLSVAYDTYQTANGALDNCSQCHPGFDAGFGGPLHQLHVGGSQMTNTCTACHVSPGSLPVSTSESGDGVGCIGCHEPFGLRLHHINAGAPTDSNGLSCTTVCHSNDGPPPVENIVSMDVRPYYLRDDVNLTDPCEVDPLLGGEDYSGNGEGLDNDGDLLYDGDDPDCAGFECMVDADCDDDVFCNGFETCDPVDFVCLPGIPPDCDDGVGCTVDVCDPDLDACVNTPDDGNCPDDGIFCNGEEVCDAAADCVSTGNPCSGATPICDEENNACVECLTLEDCGPLQICLDGNCLDVDCLTPEDCDDGVACTIDECENDICFNVPSDALCPDDGTFCNGEEICDANDGCVSTGNPCSGETPVCDPVNEQCVECLEDADCAIGEECVLNVCVPAPDCTIDADCDDTMFCNGAEVCIDGICLPGMPPDCDDGVDCTVDTCDDINDVCVNTPDDGFCGDGNVCNGTETCDPVNGCQLGMPLDCDDGNLCTMDSCDPMTGCANVPVMCPPGEQCDPETGECIVPPDCEIDEDCDDTMFCNGAEICIDGTCLPGMPVDCDDGVDCTVDTCDEDNDVCENTPDDGFCDDGNVCNGTETCAAVDGCLPGTPLDCDDGNLCTMDSCDPMTGCANVPVMCPPGEVCNPDTGMCMPAPDCTIDADCDDTIFCNGAEICIDGMCLPGLPPDCDDGVDCTLDTCDEINDVCVNTPDDGACPDDGLFCTGEEICDPELGCVSTGDPCPPKTVCNEDTDMCDEGVARRVTICHIPPDDPDNAHTITVSFRAVPAHLAHGDTLGPCPGDE